MNFLSKTFSTLTGNSIPYTFQDKIIDPRGGSFPDNCFLWTVYDGINPKNDNAPVSIFEFNLKDGINIQNDWILPAKNCFRKSKLLKLPGVLQVIDYIEDDNNLYIITEPVTPLYTLLQDENLSVASKIFGVYQIGQTLLLVNSNNNLHGNLNMLNSVFVTPSGDWKLFGFELLTNLNSDPEQPIYRFLKSFPGFESTAPEDGIDSVRQSPLTFDSYKFGAFIWGIFNPTALKNINDRVSFTQLNGMTNIPRDFAKLFRKLINQKANLRCTIDRFMKEMSGVFSSNHLIEFNNELEELKFQNDAFKLQFFKNQLEGLISFEGGFPPGFLEYKVLPELLNQYDSISKTKPTISTTPEAHLQRQETISLLLNYIIKFAVLLPQTQFSKLVKPVIFQAFTLQDRSIRLILLNHLSEYAKYLSDTDVQQKLFYPLLTGFQDTNFTIREVTLTSVSLVIDKISEKQINQELLKVLAKSQMDPKPSIRTNTLVLIIKISSKIYALSRNNVLITALSKSLKDTFTPCKLTALTGFESLVQEFSLTEICGKILGHLAVSLMDPNSYKTRVQAKRVFDLYLRSVEEHADGLPKGDPDDLEEEEKFYKKYAPIVEKDDGQSNSGGNSDWGIGFGFAKLSLGGETANGLLDRGMNVSTPDLTRVPTAEIGDTTSQLVSTIEDDFELDESWGDEEVPPQPPKRAIPATKVAPRPLSKKSGLKLGTKPKKAVSALKLDVKIEDDGDEWDGDW